MRLVQVSARPASVRKYPKRHTKRWLGVTLSLTLLTAIQLLRPLPNATLVLSLPALPKINELQLAWPGSGQASLAAEGYGILALYGKQEPLATASIAKVITALCVLEKYPLNGDAPGPTLTMSNRDVVFYQEQISQNGSRLPVELGQALTERQALEAIMIPSANNIADSLVRWAFGDQTTYAAYANDYLQRKGLVHTRVGTDASGYDPSTVSTAEDLARLGSIARKNAVLMDIARQDSASFGESGVYTNYNTALGKHGINGIKTGNNDQNPGALLFTADVQTGSHTLELSGSVMGAESLAGAIGASEALVESALQNFEAVSYTQAGQIVGEARTAWGASTPIRTKKALELVRWKAEKVTEQHTLRAASATVAGSAGALVVHAGEVQSSTTLEITTPADKPSVWWRLTRLK